MRTIRLPVPAATAAIWAFASVLFIGVFAVRDRSAAWTFTPSNAPASRALIEAGVLSAFGALCLWQQLRRVFLTGRSQATTFAALWLLFAAGYPVIGGLLILAAPEVRWVGPFAPNVDWTLTAQAIAAGQLAFVAAMAASLIWNLDEPGFAGVRLNQYVAVQVLDEIEAGRALDDSRRRQLEAALKGICDDAPKLSAKLVSKSDAAVLYQWRDAADVLLQTIIPRPVITADSLEDRTVKNARDTLRAQR